MMRHSPHVHIHNSFHGLLGATPPPGPSSAPHHLPPATPRLLRSASAREILLNHDRIANATANNLTLDRDWQYINKNSERFARMGGKRGTASAQRTRPRYTRGTRLNGPSCPGNDTLACFGRARAQQTFG